MFASANRRLRASAWLAAACLLLAACWPFAAGAQRAAGAPRAAFEHSTDRLIVKWRAHSATQAKIQAAPDRRVPAPQLAALSALAGTGLAPHRAMSGGAQVIKVSGRRSLAEMHAIAARLASHPDVEFAVPDQRRFPMLQPNDGYFADLQKGLKLLNVPAAWDLTTGDPSLVVAVIDTGVLPHADLAGRLLPGYDFVADNYLANDGNGRDAGAADPGDWVSPEDVADMNSPFDAGCLYGEIYESPSSWHGTSIAGIIAANGNNNSFMAGINWGSKILPVRVLGKCGGFDADIIDGMRWAAGIDVPGVPSNPTPAKVLNLSLGGSGSCNAAYRSAISEIGALGAVIVASAGNENRDFKQVTPGGCDGVIAVAAFQEDGNGRASYSNFGIAADTNLFAMPGDNVYSLVDQGLRGPVGDDILPSYGTSGAAAHMSGLVSLMLSANPSLTPAQVLQMLQHNASSLGPWSGSGKPDALRAVGEALAFQPAKTPVSMAISGPASIFMGNATAAYTATVTWSDSSTSQGYPVWSLGASSLATINSVGVLFPGSAPGDGTATVQASFSLNGATVTASKTVDVLANTVQSVIIDGPATVDVKSASPAIYSFTTTRRDGTVAHITGGGVVIAPWTASTGAIETNGTFRPGALGPATITVDVFGTLGTFNLTVTDTSPAPPPVTLNCASESTAGLTLDQVNMRLVGDSADLIPLCDGKVLVMDQTGRRVDLVDVRTGANERSWPFAAMPRAMQLDAATGKLFVAFYTGTQVASVDIAANSFVYLPVDGAAGALANGENGQMFVLHWPMGSDLFPASVSVFDTASGVNLTPTPIPLNKPADKLFYSRSLRILIAANFFQRASFKYTPATQALDLQNYLTDAGIQTGAVSPDGTRIVANARDNAFDNMTRGYGIFPNSQNFDFSADGRKLVTGSVVPLSVDPSRALMLFSADTHVLRRTWAISADSCAGGSSLRPRLSPSGAFLYAIQTCSGYGRLVWIAQQPEPSPDEFPFQSQVGVAPGALTASGAVPLAGFTGSATVSVAGGEYRINGGTYTAAAGTASAGQTIEVRTTAPAQAIATASVTVTVGTTPSTFLVSTGAPLAASWWDGACASEADLGNAALVYADIDPSADMIPLCDGRVLVGNSRKNQVQLYDLRAGAAIRSWQLRSNPAVLKRVPGTATLLVASDSSNISRVDLNSGQVAEILVGGRVYDMTPGEPGQVIVASQSFPTANTLQGDTLTRHDIASGAELERQQSSLTSFVGATLLRYDPVRQILYAGDGTHSPARISRLQGFNLIEYSLEAGDYAKEIVLSPDGASIVYPVEGNFSTTKELDPLNLNTPKGKWFSGPSARAADYNAAGSKLLFGNERGGSEVNGIEMFDVATRALERSWLLPHCQMVNNNIVQAHLLRTRFSPSGAYALAIEDCGGLFARLFWVRTDAASTMPKPDPASFVAQTGVPFSQVITSNTITITGLGDLWLPISVDNGQYQVSSPLFTAFPSFIRDGDKVHVNNVSWFTANTKNTTTLNIGGTLFKFDVTTGSSATDLTPDPFALMTLKQQALNTVLESNVITVSGINAPAPISVIGGSYSINGGAYTSAAGTVSSGQTVTVKVTSPGVANSANSAILTIGTASSAFTAATGAFDNTPDSLAFASRKQPSRNTWVESSPLAVTGLGGPALASVAGGELRVGAGAFSATPAVVQQGDTVTVRAMSGATLGATSTAVLSVGTGSGSFSTTVTAPLRDHDGNGKSDVFWLNTTSTQTYVWQMNGTTIAASGTPSSTGDQKWEVKGVGDFDGDGRTDVLFRHAVSGATFVWLMNGTSIVGTGSPGTVSDAGWQVQGVGDFNGDGKADVLWMHSDGTVQIWFMNGTASSSTPTVVSLGAGSGWTVQGIGDFDGDGKSDILWRHTNGTMLVWLMNGAVIASSGSPANVGPTTATGWLVQGVGDFDGDGKADILWRNDDLGGIIYVWTMNGAAIAGAAAVTGVGTLAAGGWVVKAIGDYNGDGKADVFWKNDTQLNGITYVWLMNGSSIASFDAVTGVADMTWQVQSPK